MRTVLSLHCVFMVWGALPVLAQKQTGISLLNAQSPRPIAVGREKQVFIDDHFIARSRNVELRMNPPVKLGVVLRPERPWEDKSIGFCASVMEHGGVFKLFYRADSREKGASVCLATSGDGLHWNRPRIGKYGNDGLLDIQMAVSRDGVKYRRVERAPYISLGLAGEPDSLSNYMAVGMLRVSDYLYQYYGAYAVTHGLPEAHQKMPIGCFCAVRQRLDGFVSADAASGGGELVTPPVVFTGKRLSLNIDASATGACQVGVLNAAGNDVPGFTVDACDIIHGNAVDKVVTWNDRSDLTALSGQPVRLRFVMRAAKLFAFQFVGG